MTRTEHSPLLATATPGEVDALANYASRVAGRMTADMTLGRPDRAAALVRYYHGLCSSVGVDTVLAVAQTWHETATWSSWWFRAPRRNPAGIGVTGAVMAAPPPGLDQSWQLRPDWHWGKGRAYPTYAIAAMAHVHGLAMWAGANPGPVAVLGDRCRTADGTPYSPPALARGSATEWAHLGQGHNPRHIGWAFPGSGYGVAIARLARTALT